MRWRSSPLRRRLSARHRNVTYVVRRTCDGGRGGGAAWASGARDKGRSAPHTRPLCALPCIAAVSSQSRTPSSSARCSGQRMEPPPSSNLSSSAPVAATEVNATPTDPVAASVLDASTVELPLPVSYRPLATSQPSIDPAPTSDAASTASTTPGDTRTPAHLSLPSERRRIIVSSMLAAHEARVKQLSDTQERLVCYMLSHTSEVCYVCFCSFLLCPLSRAIATLTMGTVISHGGLRGQSAGAR